MDGLMFDTERVFVKAWDYAGEKIGVGKAGYMVLKTLGMNVAMSKDVWKSEFGNYDEESLQKYTRQFLQDYYDNHKVPVKKGLYILLDYLKDNHYKLAVASSTSEREVEKNLRDAGVYQYFNVIIGGDMVTKSKPEPEIYLKACELLCENPHNCYALEDSRNGLLSAYRAGCHPIMVPDLWQPDEEIEKIICGKFEDLEEVKKFLENNNN